MFELITDYYEQENADLDILQCDILDSASVMSASAFFGMN